MWCGTISLTDLHGILPVEKVQKDSEMKAPQDVHSLYEHAVLSSLDQNLLLQAIQSLLHSSRLELVAHPDGGQLLEYISQEADVHVISSDEPPSDEDGLQSEQEEESPIVRRRAKVAKTRHVLDSDDETGGAPLESQGESPARPKAQRTDETIVCVNLTSPTRGSPDRAVHSYSYSVGMKQDGKRDMENSQAADDRSCVICHDPIGTNGGRAIMPCPKGKALEVSRAKHEFCIGCITDWAKSSEKCPLCREQFGRNSIIHQDTNGKQSCISLPPLERNDMHVEDEEQDEGECVMCDMRGFLIICDVCDRDYCLSCSGLHHPHNVPEGQWICRQCRRDTSSAQASARSGGDRRQALADAAARDGEGNGHRRRVAVGASGEGSSRAEAASIRQDARQARNVVRQRAGRYRDLEQGMGYGARSGSQWGVDDCNRPHVLT